MVAVDIAPSGTRFAFIIEEKILEDYSRTNDAMPTTKRHALVFGASGISGWAVVDQLLRDYPAAGTWDKVTALTNRPLSLETSQWPKTNNLRIVSGLNLLEPSQEVFNETMKQQIPDTDTVTHIFYYGIFTICPPISRGPT